MVDNFEDLASRLDIKNIIITMILSALGFLVALTWRDAIQQAIDMLIPKGHGLYYTFLAAIIVTVIAVVATLVLVHIRKSDIIPSGIEKKIKKIRKNRKQR